MTDTMSMERRSALMSRVRNRDTRIELVVRKALHAMGFRYRLGGAGLPGRPDIVLPRYRAVVQIHGCFWHGHDCHLFRLPKTRSEFWASKIDANRKRDARTEALLADAGWRVAVIWECALRGNDVDQSTVARRVAAWLRGGKDRLNISTRDKS